MWSSQGVAGETTVSSQYWDASLIIGMQSSQRDAVQSEACNLVLGVGFTIDSSYGCQPMQGCESNRRDANLCLYAAQWCNPNKGRNQEKSDKQTKKPRDLLQQAFKDHRKTTECKNNVVHTDTSLQPIDQSRILPLVCIPKRSRL